MNDYASVEGKTTMEGLKEFVGALGFSDRVVHTLAQQGVLYVSAQARKKARQLAPKGAGRLRRAIKNKGRRKWPTLLRADILIYKGATRDDPKGAYYWHFVERGTKHQPKQEFIYQALKKTEPEMLKYFQQKVMNAALRRAQSKVKK